MRFWQCCHSIRWCDHWKMVAPECRDSLLLLWWWCFVHLYFCYRSTLSCPSNLTNDQNLMMYWGRKTWICSLNSRVYVSLFPVWPMPHCSSSLLGCLQFTVFQVLKYSEAFLSVFRLRCSGYVPPPPSPPTQTLGKFARTRPNITVESPGLMSAGVR